MKKKIRDMVVGDKFYYNYDDGFDEYNKVFEVDCIGNHVCGTFCLSDITKKPYHWKMYSGTDMDVECEMVEPEPDWLYECIDTVNKVYRIPEFASNDFIHTNSNYIKIKGGRKMHPVTLEIVS